jgi:7,8-dihydropterin-6-yl-methyl-4-(beta-D-ribofuranosyl)aminobenzene 5'-phosphate synthase
MKLRITVLCDNAVGPISGTLGEHGFAALVEHDAGALLFDTGQGATLLHNAGRMHKELGQVRDVVLSHGHYDHTGGLLPLLGACGPKRVLAHPGVFAPRYRISDTGEALAIGIPVDRQTLGSHGAEFDLSREFRQIAPGLYLSGEVPRLTLFETGDHGLHGDDRGESVDTLPDDQSLFIVTGQGLVILLGCCHSGLVNTIEAARRLTGCDRVYGVIGGTHLGFCPDGQLTETVRALRSYGIRKICASHCTGFAAAARLFREFPGQFQPAQVGYTLEI